MSTKEEEQTVPDNDDCSSFISLLSEVEGSLNLSLPENLKDTKVPMNDTFISQDENIFEQCCDSNKLCNKSQQNICNDTDVNGELTRLLHPFVAMVTNKIQNTNINEKHHEVPITNESSKKIKETISKQPTIKCEEPIVNDDVSFIRSTVNMYDDSKAKEKKVELNPSVDSKSIHFNDTINDKYDQPIFDPSKESTPSYLGHDEACPNNRIETNEKKNDLYSSDMYMKIQSLERKNQFLSKENHKVIESLHRAQYDEMQLQSKINDLIQNQKKLEMNHEKCIMETR